jgi:hypothetical protein
MRDYDEEDLNKPRPVRPKKKKWTTAAEAEGLPWSHIKDDERDHHRHVC